MVDVIKALDHFANEQVDQVHLDPIPGGPECP
jgi:hypothetical protein